MYSYMIYVGLEVLSIWVLWGLSICLDPLGICALTGVDLETVQKKHLLKPVQG